MSERFTIPPDAKARLAMRERHDAGHETAARWPLHGCERGGAADVLLAADECEGENPPADIG